DDDGGRLALEAVQGQRLAGGVGEGDVVDLFPEAGGARRGGAGAGEDRQRQGGTTGGAHEGSAATGSPGSPLWGRKGPGGGRGGGSPPPDLPRSTRGGFSYYTAGRRGRQWPNGRPSVPRRDTTRRPAGRVLPSPASGATARPLGSPSSGITAERVSTSITDIAD